MQIEMDEERQNLILETNKKFKIMNENHLFEAMGLTLTDEQELEEIFSPEITEYLKNTVVISQADNQNILNLSGNKKKNKQKNEIEIINK